MFRNDSWLNPLRGMLATWGVVWAFLLLSVWSGLAGAQTPAGTIITNIATASEAIDAHHFYTTSDSVKLTVGSVTPPPAPPPAPPPDKPQVVVDPDRIITAVGGFVVDLSHMVRNTGTAGGLFIMGATNTAGWPVRIYRDLNGNGVVDDGEPEITSAVSIAAGDSIRIVLRTTTPPEFKEGDSTKITITATSSTDGSITDNAVDIVRGKNKETTPPEPTASLKLEKRVDPTEAKPGDVLTYTIDFSTAGNTAASNLVITDSIPTGTVYQNGTLTLNGAPLTDVTDADAGSVVSGTTPVAMFQLGTVTPGTSGVIRFQVKVAQNASAGSTVVNRVTGTFNIGTGAAGAAASAIASTVIKAPQFNYKLTKRAVSPNVKHVGETVQYRLVATNLVNAPMQGLVVTDTLPSIIDFVSSLPTPTASQGRVLSWTVNVGPLDSTVILVNGRINSAVTERTSYRNTARAIIDTVARSDTATIFVDPTPGLKLEISLSAARLEVALGQTAILTATVRNPNSEDLTDVIAEVTLPEGTKYVKGSLSGAEFVSVSGNKLVVRIPGTLAASASAAFTYSIAIISPPSNELPNFAIANARTGSVLSNEATVVLHMLAGMAAQTNVVVGKVWADLNENGMQDKDEIGLEGVDIWTEDGAVARSDVDGKFSFLNLRLGTHVFRADPTTVPKGYMLPAREDGMQRITMDGWTTPRVSIPIHAIPGAQAMVLRAGISRKSVSESARGPGSSERPADNFKGLTQIAQLPTTEPAKAVPLLVKQTEAEPAAEEATPIVLTAPALTDEQRKADKSQDFLQGPSVEILTPADGEVVRRGRVAVIAKAEGGMPSKLMLGDSILKTSTVRPDGVQEFPGVDLAPGPNTIAVSVKNSWGNVRTDKIHVHVSGPVIKAVTNTKRVVIPADGDTATRLKVRLLDAWDVPVVSSPLVEVAFDGGTIVTPDAMASSLGHQVRADPAGWVTVDFKGGLSTGRYKLVLSSGKAKAVVDVEVIARARPLMMTGTGQIGVGAAPEAYGALSVRGRVTESTALTVSYDTRRLDDGRDAFHRATDPLSTGIYPILGDVSSMRTASAARGQISATIERGLDNVTFGDVQTSNIAEDFTLSRYSRSVTGATARVSTGAVVWSAFGASSSQSLSQIQIRGAGTSGPYNLGRKIILGTQQVQVEVRDANNAQRVIGRTALVPYIDYEIDPVRGEIVLKRALPAADPYGNSVFLVVTAESASGGERKSMWGLRVASDVKDLSGSETLKGLKLGASIVHDDQSLHPLNMLGADLRYAPSRGVDLSAELAHSDVTDSSGVAGAVNGTVKLFSDALTLNARYNKIGKGFANPTNAGLLGGTSDLSASAAVRLGKGEAKLERSEQSFGPLNISRARTQLSLRQGLWRNGEIQLAMSDDDINGGADARQLGSGEMKLSWAPIDRLKLWAEGRNRLYSRGSSENATGGSLGGGLTYQAFENIAIEARHTMMASAKGQSGYSLTNIGLRSQLAAGAQAWGSYQITGGMEGARNAAVIGLNNSFHVTNSITLSGMFERRMGVERSTSDDPVRALPFNQLEQDYWAASLGVEFLPQNKPYRLSLKSEKKDGAERTASLLAAGDITFGSTFGLLSRQEYSNRESSVALGSMSKTEHRASLWGLAWRPRDNDKINTLMELRWSKDDRPTSVGVVDRSGNDQRLSAAFEAIWAPIRRIELGSRYAIRRSTSTIVLADNKAGEDKSDASFLGTRMDVKVARFLSIRGEARGMMEGRTSAKTWDVAPAAVIRPVQGIEVVVGKRWGPLNDPDFAVNGGRGWFATFGARVTESSLPTATAFWRNRFHK